MAKTDYITASEIGDYIYCKRSWWLKTQNRYETTPQVVSGTKSHNALSFKLKLSPKLRIIALLLIGIAVLFIALIIISFTGS